MLQETHVTMQSAVWGTHANRIAIFIHALQLHALHALRKVLGLAQE